MKPNNTAVIERSGDLQGRKHEMGFDSSSIAHLMSLMTDLYSDAELAIIREYLTNARDSHVEAGNDAPIEVTTPSAMSSFFKIKDYGVGLNEDDIERIYSQYGASTKRESDTQTGMLGVGCKSALTYTNQFTLVGIKNGVKTSVMISRLDSGAGVMEVISTVPTDEPNGVEIIIPVRFSASFQDKVETFLKAWEPGTVLLNGKQPVSYKDTAKRITDRIWIVPGQGVKDIVVMGNVAYPVNTVLSDRDIYYRKFSVVAYVEMGQVAFVPSREALDYRDHLSTNKTLKELRNEFSLNLKPAVQAEIDKSVNQAEAIKTFFHYQDMFGPMTEFTYRGQTLTDRYKTNHHVWNPGKSRYQTTYNVTTADYKEVMSSLTVTDFTFDKITATQKEKIRAWMNDTDNEYFSHIILVPESVQPGLPWTKDATTVSYETIKAIRLNEKTPGQRQKRVAKYDVLNSSGWYPETDDIDDSQNIYYHSPTEYRYRGGDLRNTFPDDIIVRLGKNRYDKFKRDFPNAKHVRVALVEAVEKARKAITESDIIAASLSEWTRVRYSRMDAARFDDPELRKFVEAAKVVSPELKRYLSSVKVANEMHVYVDNLPTVLNPFDKYPLTGNGERYLEHIYAYTNAVYALNKEK